MKKKNYWIVFLIIFCAAIIGIFYFYNINSCEFVPSTEVCKEDYCYNQRTFCFLDKAAETNNVDLCNRIEEKGQYEVCVRRVANSKLDYKICDILSDDSEWKALCYTDLAVSLNDSVICNRISESSSYLKQPCLEAVKNVYTCDQTKCYSRSY